MSALGLSFEGDYRIWDFRGTPVIYDYRRGQIQLFEQNEDFLLLPPGTAERQPSGGAYNLRRRMLFVPIVEFQPLPGDSFKIETEHDDWTANNQEAAGQLETVGQKLYERWWVESVSRTRAMYACRCVRAELIAAHCQQVTITRPKAQSDGKGHFVTVQEPWKVLYARVQPVDYQEVDEQARKSFKRFYKVWVNPDLEPRHRGLAIEMDGGKYQIVDVRSRQTMQDLTELLVAANV